MRAPAQRPWRFLAALAAAAAFVGFIIWAVPRFGWIIGVLAFSVTLVTLGLWRRFDPSRGPLERHKTQRRAHLKSAHRQRLNNDTPLDE